MVKIGVWYPFLLYRVPKPSRVFFMLLQTIARLRISELIRLVLLLVCYGLRRIDG